MELLRVARDHRGARRRVADVVLAAARRTDRGARGVRSGRGGHLRDRRRRRLEFQHSRELRSLSTRAGRRNTATRSAKLGPISKVARWTTPRSSTRRPGGTSSDRCARTARRFATLDSRAASGGRMSALSDLYASGELQRAVAECSTMRQRCREARHPDICALINQFYRGKGERHPHHSMSCSGAASLHRHGRCAREFRQPDAGERFRVEGRLANLGSG